MLTCLTDFQIKSLLSVDSYKVFSKALMEYKKQEDLLKVVAVLADLFTEDKRNHHLFASKFGLTASVGISVCLSFKRDLKKLCFTKGCIWHTDQGCLIKAFSVYMSKVWKQGFVDYVMLFQTRS